jgi:hypothetical protein
VERWRSDCGCRTGGDPAWNQKWRTPLRDGFDWLRDQLIVIFERESAGVFRDPWGARDDYSGVVASGYDPFEVNGFLERNAPGLTPELRVKALSLMESQLMSLYMFTSCAWFFDDIAGLEPVQNMRYAARAIELCQRWTPKNLTQGLMDFLRRAEPNDTAYQTGEDVWRGEVAGTELSSGQTAAQWAASLAVKAPGTLKDCRYTKIANESSERVYLTRGDELPQLLTGSAEFTEARVGETRRRFVLVLADNGPKLDIVAPEEEAGAESVQKARRLFLESGPAALRGSLESLFPGAERFTLDSLWPGVREEILGHVLKDFFEDLLSYTSKAFHNYRDALFSYSLKAEAWDWMDAFVFRVMAENELAHILKPMADGRPIDMDHLKKLLSADPGGPTRNIPVISEASEKYLGNLFRQLKYGPGRPTLLEEIESFLKLVKSTLKDVDLWDSQNQFYYLLENKLCFLRSITDPEKKLIIEIGKTLGFSPKIAESVIINQPL